MLLRDLKTLVEGAGLRVDEWTGGAGGKAGRFVTLHIGTGYGAEKLATVARLVRRSWVESREFVKLSVVDVTGHDEFGKLFLEVSSFWVGADEFGILQTIRG